MVVLESSKLFSGLHPEEWKSFREAVQVKSFAPSETIFREGDAGDGIYLVKEGRIEISAVVQGERRPLSELGPGEFFGEMAVLDNEPRSATVTAQGAVTLYFIPRAELLQRLDNSPRLAISLLREFSLRLRDFNKQYIKELLQAERLALVGRFARSIVHDFKNPLNVIGLASELMGMQGASLEMKESAATRIRKQVDRLGNMINELLEFTKGSQNSVVLANVNYKTYVEEVLEDLRLEAADRGVEIQTTFPVEEVDILLDSRRLTHVFHNLIHNAVDAISDGGTIFIRAHRSGNEMITEIEDTGKGFAPEIFDRLFQPFATFGKAQGSGLGLSICKKIVQDHQGWIVPVREPGRGAVFRFGLPVRPST
ncbi:MAG: hypothetical protein JWM99_2002 [Verrucomicrobiales bacterium]|nr:hypothetical protein [Verrucomicrobiales bacterium]